MKYMTVLLHQEDLSQYTSSKLDVLALATEGLSAKGYPGFDLETVKQLVFEIKRSSLQWAWILPTLILEKDFELFIEQMEVIIALSPDAIIVSDVGAFDVLRKQNLAAHLILQTDTTITNPYDVQAFLDLKADVVGLAREVTFDEIQGVLSHTHHVMISIFGHQLMSISKRPLLTNYFKLLSNEPLERYTPVFLKEEKRDELYVAIEDESGFNIYSSTILETFDEINQLQHPDIYGWIEPMFLSPMTIVNAVDLFKSSASSEHATSQLTPLLQASFSKGLLYTPTSAKREV